MKKLFVIIALMFGTTAFGQDYNNAWGYYGAGHLTTEILIKSNKRFNNEYEVSGYNRALSGFVTMFIITQSAQQSSRNDREKFINITSGALGVVTGNVFQWEW